MRTHTGERPYKCPYCDRSYAQSNDLLKHTRIHVGGNIFINYFIIFLNINFLLENTYKCSVCQAAFRLQAQLREHYRIHYNMGTPPHSDMIDEKPEIIAEMDMIVDQERRCQEQMQFVNSIIKSENLESEIYENLSSKKQKLN